MKQYLVATVGKTGKLYFVPGGERYDGIYVNGQDIMPVSIFSFVSRRSDVNRLQNKKRQRDFWKLDFNDESWAEKHFIKLNKNRKTNPYNKKARNALNSIEEASSGGRKRMSRPYRKLQGLE